MFSLSRLSMLIAAFFLGFSASAGLIAGAAYYATNSVSINKIEELTSGKVDIPTEHFIGDNPDVDLCDLALTDLVAEMASLATIPDQLTINFLISRYDLILADEVDKILSEESRNIPLSSLLTTEGREKLLNNLYVGQMQGFECRKPDGTKGKPSDEGSYWYNPATGDIVNGLNDVLADISIGDFLTGRVSADSVLRDVFIGDIVGYTFNEELGYWLDSEGQKATGVMAVFAGCTVLTVDDKLKTEKIGNLIGYDEIDGEWCELGEDGEWVPVHGFMSVVASKTMDNVNGLMDDLTIGDIVPEDERKGFIGMISPDTHFNDIPGEVNTIFDETPMRTFVENGIITFDTPEAKEKFLNSGFADYNISELLSAVTNISSSIPTT